jgi:hypothetical protein
MNDSPFRHASKLTDGAAPIQEKTESCRQQMSFSHLVGSDAHPPAQNDVVQTRWLCLIRSSSQAASKKAKGLIQGRKLPQNVMHREWICGMDGMLGDVRHMTPHAWTVQVIRQLFGSS